MITFKQYIYICPCSIPCIAHHVPRYIEVLPNSIVEQALGDAEVEMDLFDAMLRILSQADKQIYKRHAEQRWRHFIESNFLVSQITTPVIHLA